MDPTPSSSRSASSSSIWIEEITSSESASSSISTAARNTPNKRPTPTPTREHTAASRSRLSRPFRSPLKRSQSQQSMVPTAPPATATSAGPSSQQTPADVSASSSASVRKQRQALEGRLLLLQQANKCLREDALSALPQEIARWREAGQLAAQDLWKMTGAQGGDWSATGGIPSRGDYGLESPPSTLVGTQAFSSSPRKRKPSESPESSSPPWLLRRSRFTSPGAEEEAAALRSTDDPFRRLKGEDSQGTDSQASLPELSELIRRSQSIIGSSSTPRRHQSLLGTQDDGPSTSSTPATGARGIERKWNIGSMLDMLGADKSTLEWDVEEEDFRDPGANKGVTTRAPQHTD
ncbi:uncharacterized protein UTRI_04483_B [Ustilago trichophora]|uniref:Uncharacterized protein n=1 Tax=Ustilago trichophora TaxID=86804 RepID=A0A5C3EBU9_9BASI|nr:uncharacterized protein UTRI_04483_B [Ustilago trichophora]